VDQADTTGSSKNGGLISSDFKFTNGNEKVVAAAGTLNNGDVLADGSTTDNDVLDATLTGGAVLTSSITNIETINLDVKVAGSGLSLASVSGVDTINVNTNVGIAAALNAVNATNAPLIGLSGSGVLTATAVTLAGKNDSLSVQLNGTTGNAGFTVAATTAGALETLNLESAGDTANTVAIAAGVGLTGLTKTIVTGEADLNARVAHLAVTGQTIDASEHEGELNLVVDRNGAITATTNLTNVSGVDTYTFRDSVAGGDQLVVSGLVDGANVVVESDFNGANSLAIKGAAANTANTLNITLDHATAATNVAIGTGLTIADVETINFISEGGT